MPIILVWFVIIVVHGVKTLLGNPYTMENEMELERSLTYRRYNTPQPDKRKHTLADTPPPVRLNADGELTNSTVEAWEAEK
jgi:hypothetical protein